MNVTTLLNKERLNNKNKWFSGNITIQYTDGEKANVSYKGYNTWLQILRIDNMNAGFPMELTATQFKERLNTIFGEAVTI